MQADFQLIDKIQAHPYEFIKHCVYTRDEVDQFAPIKRAPNELPYVKMFCNLFLTERLLAVPKSRRMWVTWMALSCFLWDTMFHKIRTNFIVSKKEEDADELLSRAEFILENIPEFVIPKNVRPKHKRLFCYLGFPELGSEMKAVPQGADQLRQYTASGIFFDEFGFWPDAEDTYGGSMPTAQGGGRVVIVSTPPDNAPVSGSFWEKLCFDKL